MGFERKVKQNQRASARKELRRAMRDGDEQRKLFIECVNEMPFLGRLVTAFQLVLGRLPV